MSGTTTVTTTRQNRLQRNYNRIARFYETSAHVFSTGQIAASKRDQLSEIQPGDSVLFLGVGAGEDAVAAAAKGARVSCVDISSGMLDLLRRKLEKRNLKANLICESAFSFSPTSPFDVVCANYFLNVFRKNEMVRMLNHATTLVRPGGRFMIADVTRPTGNPLSRAFNVCYLKSAMAAYWAMGTVRWHENYDYESYLQDAGLKHLRTKQFRLAGCGPVLFQNIVAVRRIGNEGF